MLLRRPLSLTVAVVGLAAIHGCAQQLPVAPDVPAEEVQAVPAAKNDKVAAKAPVAEDKRGKGCRVSGRIISTEWRDLGGEIERAIVTAWPLPDLKQVEDVYMQGEGVELHLPPGKYRLVCSAVGTRGATFKVQTREITIANDQKSFDLGKVDLPISKTTGLYGLPAPELSGIIAWQNTPPMTIKQLRGKVVVLDFFAIYCSICHAHKPDLEELRKRYAEQGLVVLAIHDNTLKTLDEMNEKMEPILHKVFDGNPPQIPMALDGPDENSVCEAYGVHAVPAVILIDQQGRVVRRYHHAGKPELEADVQALLNPAFNRR